MKRNDGASRQGGMGGGGGRGGGGGGRGGGGLSDDFKGKSQHKSTFIIYNPPCLLILTLESLCDLK